MKSSECLSSLIILILATLILIEPGHTRCPEGGRKLEHRNDLGGVTTYSCTQQNLTEIPSDIPRNVQEIMLWGNNVKVVKTASFSNWTKCFKINLNGNSIRKIQRAAFMGMDCTSEFPNLCMIILARNKLRNIKATMWIGLEKVSYLNLDHNALTSISNESFGHLDIHELRLNSNNLIHVDPLSFKLMPSLHYLHLSYNALQWIPCFSDSPSMSRGRMFDGLQVYKRDNPLKCQPKSCWVEDRPEMRTYGKLNCNISQESGECKSGDYYLRVHCCRAIETCPSETCLREKYKGSYGAIIEDIIDHLRATCGTKESVLHGITTTTKHDQTSATNEKHVASHKTLTPIYDAETDEMSRTQELMGKTITEDTQLGPLNVSHVSGNPSSTSCAHHGSSTTKGPHASARSPRPRTALVSPTTPHRVRHNPNLNVVQQSLQKMYGAIKNKKGKKSGHESQGVNSLKMISLMMVPIKLLSHW